MADATAQGDIVMVLVPDHVQAGVYRDQIAPNLRAGSMLMFAHGFSIRFGAIEPSPDVDVAMIAPKGPGHLVRRQYLDGIGVPGLVAVHQDATGNALALALAYGHGLGCARGGLIETTFTEETETDLFGEQAVLCGGTTAAGQDGLRDAGRGRLPARDRLLRVPARAEADRRPDVGGRPRRHALLDLRHGRVRRPHRAARG